PDETVSRNDLGIEKERVPLRMPRLVRSDSGPWAGGLGVTSQCRTEPSQATRVDSFHNGAGARIKNGKNVAMDHQFQHAFTNVSCGLRMPIAPGRQAQGGLRE